MKKIQSLKKMSKIFILIYYKYIIILNNNTSVTKEISKTFSF